ncbi:hypothetical protein M3Y97_00917900 [Aphelenchoides bicaudatus]|nr:hypothetical protein M3Y97_00917900 [Aphelenchoides bicaudatus]
MPSHTNYSTAYNSKRLKLAGQFDNARWLIEGIADYARNQFGKQNAAANWKLSTYSSGQKYTDGYTVTGGFLKYIEGKWNGTVKKLFDAQYALNYNDSLFKTLTGKSLQDLWTDYSKTGSSGRKKRNINNPKFAKIQSE